MKILIVGGGTAGLVSAIILKKRLNAQVDVVHSKNIGIIGVGEGSTEHFSDFLKFAEIDPFEIIQECDATYKSGIMFDNWHEKPYIHSVGPVFGLEIGQYPISIANRTQKNYLPIVSENVWKNKIHKRFLDKQEGEVYYQFHFNTHKLNDFLIKKANKIKIKIIEDDINKVIFKENGEIDHLVGDKQSYNYDFYIDATGFKRLLIGKMGAKWISFGKYLKMKSAIVFPTEDTEEYNLWTTAKAMDYGWRFQIPVWGRHGNGYIFDSDYITADQAKEELDKEFGFDVEISKQFNFDPGYLDRVWIKNCVAIGLSGSFVEPLEATSIGSSIQQSFMLMHKILNYSDVEINTYNKQFSHLMENIRDFICLHYITPKENTVFWKDLKNIEIPESLKNNLNKWNNKMPIFEDLVSHPYILFSSLNFAWVMHGLRLFNLENIKKEYMLINKNLRDEVDLLISQDSSLISNSIKLGESLGHKDFLRIIRKKI